MKKQTKRKIELILVNGLIFFIQIVFFTFIHEFGHYLSAVLLGFKNVELFIHPLGVATAISDPIVYDANAYRIFAVSGSLFDLPCILISLYYGKKKRILGSYFASWVMLFVEELSWAISPIIECGDGYLLLKHTPDLNSELFILTFFTIFVFSFILFNLDFHNYVKKGVINLEK
ncbi:MAG: hypothetical protein ACFE8A_13500 [Candidatus Hodarchaeota archaeon]